MMPSVPSRCRLLAPAATALLLVAGCTFAGPTPPAVPPPPAAPPNIVFILVDDLSMNLVPYMTQVEALASEGVSFANFIVTDSQCCPSRATTLTGRYPHNTHVQGNQWPTGGFGRFMQEGFDSSLGTLFHDSGYRTGYIGKFLNGYEPTGVKAAKRDSTAAPSYPPGYVPPGWDEWHVAGSSGYKGFNYTMASAVDRPTGSVRRYGYSAEDYLTDVMTDTAEEFLDRAAPPSGLLDQPSEIQPAAPFLLVLAPFAVHSRIRGDGASRRNPDFPAAPRDRPAAAADRTQEWAEPDFPDGDCGEQAHGGCAGVPFPPPGVAEFNVVPENAPRWMPDHPLNVRRLPDLEEDYLDRIRTVQSVNDMIGAVRARLAELELDEQTYIVFSSDNGFHLGEHGLAGGKLTAFDHDVRVPLIVRPPGGTSARTVVALGQNTDLLPTFLDIADIPATGVPMDGVTLLGLLRGEAPAADWRRAALVEFTSDRGTAGNSQDPDYVEGARPPSYRALRTSEYLYIDYSAIDADVPRPERAEFYDLSADPAALHNIAGDLDRVGRELLNDSLQRYAACQGEECRVADAGVPSLSSVLGGELRLATSGHNAAIASAMSQQ